VGAVDGAVLLEPPAGSPARAEGALLRIDMPPADPAAAGAVLTRTDWATAAVTVQLGPQR
jgi:hypothetical protein